MWEEMGGSRVGGDCLDGPLCGSARDAAVCWVGWVGIEHACKYATTTSSPSAGAGAVGPLQNCTWPHPGYSWCMLSAPPPPTALQAGRQDGIAAPQEQYTALQLPCNTQPIPAGPATPYQPPLT
jgi:hypothetical protein